MVLILPYAPVPPAPATAPAAQRPASQRKQCPCQAPIRPPARAAAITRSAPAKWANAPALPAQRHRGAKLRPQAPRRLRAAVAAILRVARVLRASVPVVDVGGLRLDFHISGGRYILDDADWVSLAASAPAPAPDSATSQTAPLVSTTTQPLDSTVKQ